MMPSNTKRFYSLVNENKKTKRNEWTKTGICISGSYSQVEANSKQTNKHTLNWEQLLFIHLLRNKFEYRNSKFNAFQLRERRILSGLRAESHVQVVVHTLYIPCAVKKVFTPEMIEIYLNTLLAMAKKKDAVPLIHETKTGDAIFSQTGMI